MKKLIYTFVFLIATTTAANAYVDSQYMTSEQYLINTGYSKEMARVTKMQTTNPYQKLTEEKDKRKFYQKAYEYIDPCANQFDTFPRHDTKFNSNWQDL